MSANVLYACCFLIFSPLAREGRIICLSLKKKMIEEKFTGQKIDHCEANSRFCATTTYLYLIPKHLHHPKVTTPTHKHPLPILPSPTAWQPRACFLSPWIYSFWTFHTNGSTQYVAFVSGFFHSASCFRGSPACASMCQCFTPFRG